MTLTSALPDDARPPIRDLLAGLSAPACVAPVAFRSPCLFAQADPGAPFVLAARYPFAAG